MSSFSLARFYIVLMRELGDEDGSPKSHFGFPSFGTSYSKFADLGRDAALIMIPFDSHTIDAFL